MWVMWVGNVALDDAILTTLREYGQLTSRQIAIQLGADISEYPYAGDSCEILWKIQRRLKSLRQRRLILVSDLWDEHGSLCLYSPSMQFVSVNDLPNINYVWDECE